MTKCAIVARPCFSNVNISEKYIYKKYIYKKSENISAFSVSIFVGTSVSWYALVVSKLKISFNISSLVDCENENKGFLFDLFLRASAIVSMLG